MRTLIRAQATHKRTVGAPLPSALCMRIGPTAATPEQRPCTPRTTPACTSAMPTHVSATSTPACTSTTAALRTGNRDAHMRISTRRLPAYLCMRTHHPLPRRQCASGHGRDCAAPLAHTPAGIGYGHAPTPVPVFVACTPGVHRCLISARDDSQAGAEIRSRTLDVNGEQERHIMREVVWDACEHSFRFELRALDRLAGEVEWDGNPVGRDRMVAAVFGGSYTVDSVPNFNIGLLSDDMLIRMRSMEALRKIMKAWPDHPYEVKHLTYTEGMAEAFEKGQGLDLLRRCEKALAEFYCQTFYNWFGRPAIVPHFVPLRPCSPTP
ncbi:hypothetical protein PLICRDRAFT_170784 [Plicaturopsis crispa FD-325 SS-3]|nr:hypothetical protein PLICRDRAFT_170784 [Plicaturopsis crispa FD-325 SS-3]